MNRRDFLRNGIKGTLAYTLLPATLLATQHASASKAVATDTTKTVTESEIEHLLYMREEEKLARDVYLTMHDTWGLQVFANIAESEQEHTDAVALKIAKYRLDDPVEDDVVGLFVNEKLAALYNTLVEQGKQSELSALYVGAAIEEIDMIDIQHAIDGSDQPDIIRTYENLMDGSKSHLRGFVDNITATGIPYVAQYLSQDEVDAILAG